VITTSASSVTMKNETPVSASAQRRMATSQNR
jgi:hypothetical protein